MCCGPIARVANTFANVLPGVSYVVADACCGKEADREAEGSVTRSVEIVRCAGVWW